MLPGLHASAPAEACAVAMRRAYEALLALLIDAAAATCRCRRER